GADDLDLDEPLERRQQQRRVVGDAARRRRQRREVRDLHATGSSNLSMHVSHVTALATSRPARPNARASSACSRSHVHATASSSTLGATTSPVSWSRTMSSGPPASVAVITGFCERKASYGTSP